MRVRPVFSLLCGAVFLCWTTGARSMRSAQTEYPAEVLKLTGNRQPFTPARPRAAYEFPLKKLIAAKRGIHFGSALKLTIEPLGEKHLLVDTAGRGLLLKSAEQSGKDIVRVPGWILPGPGLQTGIFQILGRLSAREFSMEPAVAELFQERGFTWVDGIISTEIFRPWVVRLDFRRSTLNLIPYEAPVTGTRTECDARLDRNWWIVKATVRGKPANLVLDSGAAQTTLDEWWVTRNFGGAARRNRNGGSSDSKLYDAGVWDIAIPGLAPFNVSCLCAKAGQMPLPSGVPTDGLLGFDALRELTLEFDYKAAKLYLRR